MMDTPIVLQATGINKRFPGVLANDDVSSDLPERLDDPCKRPFLHDTKFRVASISKMALAMGVEKLAAEGRLDLDADVSRYLGGNFANPYFPGRAITTRQLLAHLSSVRDPEEYWVAAPGNFLDLRQG